MKKSLMAVLLLGLGFGCSTPPDVSTHYDLISGLRTDLMAENVLETEGPPREVVWLNASRVFQKSGDQNYYLEVSYMATKEVGFLEIAPGDSLIITADGNQLTFNGRGSGGLRESSGDYVRERAIYEATRVRLQEIALAKEVKVQIKGRNGLIERSFKEPNFSRFREFVTRYAL